MLFDIVAIVLLIGLIGLGAWTGFLSQLAGLGCAIAAAAFAPAFAPAIQPSLAGIAPQLGDAGTGGIALAVAGVGLYLVFMIGAWFAIRVVRGVSDVMDTMDRVAGAVVGAAEALIIIYVAGNGMLIARDRLGPDINESVALRIVDEVEIDRWVNVETLRRKLQGDEDEAHDTRGAATRPESGAAEGSPATAESPNSNAALPDYRELVVVE